MKKSRWQFYERAQREVYRKLKARERPEAVVGAGWGFLDHFFIFLFSLGFFVRIDFRPTRVKRIMIPTVLMILTYEMKQLMGISSMNQLEEHPCLQQAGVSGYGPFKDHRIYGPSDSGGVLLWWLWKKMRIRFVIPARSNMPACRRQGGEPRHSGISFGEGRWPEGFPGTDQRDEGDGGERASLL